MSNKDGPAIQSPATVHFHVTLCVLIIEAILMNATALFCGREGLCTLADYSSDLFVAGALCFGFFYLLSGGGGGDPDYATFWGKPLPLPTEIESESDFPYPLRIFIVSGLIASGVAVVLSMLIGLWVVVF
jgi:hypothetical protein